jgi:probable phosphoglycerate mutase
LSEPTTILLVRHGHTDFIGRALAGRRPDVHLTAHGHDQAERLALRLTRYPITAVYSSPLDRARETAAPLARALGLEVRIAEEASELDFGEWTGRTFRELDADPRWHAFNARRSETRAPGGELMAEAQARIVAVIDRIRRAHPGERVAIVSHADVIRAALAHHAGILIDVCHRIEIRPASVSTIRLGDEWEQIAGVNDTGDLAW